MTKNHLNRTIRRADKVKNFIREREHVNIPQTKPKDTIKNEKFLNNLSSNTTDIMITGLRLHHLIPLRQQNKIRINQFKIISKDQEKKLFPLLYDIKRHENAAIDVNKNPLFWSVEEVKSFLRIYVGNAELENCFVAEEIDGCAFLNLDIEILTQFFKLTYESAESFVKLIKKLKDETISKFANVEYID